MISLYVYRNNELKDVELPNVLSEHSNRYKIDSKRQLSRYAYYLLSLKLKELGYRAEDITFTERGKAIHPEISFSISHTKNYIALAISNEPVGVDVEGYIPLMRQNLANRILSDEEYVEYTKCEDQIVFLTQKWTEKEAEGKRCGTGITTKIFQNKVDCFNFDLKDAIVSVSPNMNVKMYLDDALISS